MSPEERLAIERAYTRLVPRACVLWQGSLRPAHRYVPVIFQLKGLDDPLFAVNPLARWLLASPEARQLPDFGMPQTTDFVRNLTTGMAAWLSRCIVWQLPECLPRVDPASVPHDFIRPLLLERGVIGANNKVVGL